MEPARDEQEEALDLKDKRPDGVAPQWSLLGMSRKRLAWRAGQADRPPQPQWSLLRMSRKRGAARTARADGDGAAMEPARDEQEEARSSQQRRRWVSRRNGACSG